MQSVMITVATKPVGRRWFAYSNLGAWVDQDQHSKSFIANWTQPPLHLHYFSISTKVLVSWKEYKGIFTEYLS